MPPRTVPLLNGTYKAKSVIASAQRTVNLYPEFDPQDSEVPVTHYPAPGLKTLSTPTFGPGFGRGLYLATNGVLYAVVGELFYIIDNLWNFTNSGALDNGSNPVSMTDNGQELLIVSGPGLGYTFNFSTGIFAKITDPNYFGGDYCGYLDGFTLFNRPGTNQFYSTLANQILPLDSLYFASKAGFPDNIVGLQVVHREIQLIGELTTEIWYNAGNPLFPFAIIPGVFLQQGCAAKYSIARHDLTTFWLAKDKDGKAIAVQVEKYQCTRISTPALEQEWASYSAVSDAVAFIYQLGGHIFYQLTFVGADKTFVYDYSTKQWHERTWTDSNGNEHRHRAQCATNAYETIVVLDWETGTLYAFDGNTYQDGTGPIVYRRGFPHITNSGSMSTYNNFKIDMEVGQSQDGTYPQISLRWSNDRGQTFGNPITQSFGQGGQYLTSVNFKKLGRARDRVFEIFWSSSVKTALNGAYLTYTPGPT